LEGEPELPKTKTERTQEQNLRPDSISDNGKKRRGRGGDRSKGKQHKSLWRWERIKENFGKRRNTHKDQSTAPNRNTRQKGRLLSIKPKRGKKIERDVGVWIKRG